jgi:hypothetical protein
MTRECGRILGNDTEQLSLYSTSKLSSLCGSAKVLEEQLAVDRLWTCKVVDERRRERAKQLIK